MEAMISRKKIVKSIGLMHPFTYRGPSSKHRTNVHVIRPNPPCKYVSKSKVQCSSHLLVPLEALDRDRLESLVLRSELSLPRLELASNERGKRCQDKLTGTRVIATVVRVIVAHALLVFFTPSISSSLQAKKQG